jgi:Na+/melibiose symporter-like transporter
MPSYASLLIIYGAWGLATGLTFWAAQIKLVTMLARRDQQGRFFGILEGGRGLIEALLATIAIALFAYVLSQESGTKTLALKQVIYLYAGVLLIMAPLTYWLLDDAEAEPEQTKSRVKDSFRNDIMVVLKHREIWLCAICIACGYQLFYATYSFSAYLQQNFGLTAVMVGTITVAKLWMRPIGGIAAGFIGDWIGPEKVLSTLLALASLALAMMAVLPANAATLFMLTVVLLIGLLTYAVRGLYWATLGACNVPNNIKGLAIGIISMIGYFPEVYLPLLSASLIEQYPDGLGYQIYYLTLSIFGLLGAYAAYLLARPKI